MKGLTTLGGLAKGLKGMAAMKGGLKGMGLAARGLGKNARGVVADGAKGAYNRAKNLVRSKGSDPVDMATGSMFLPQTDVELPGLLPLAFTRRVASDYRCGWWFGPTWASTIDQRLETDEDGIVFVTEDGLLLAYPHPSSAQVPVIPEAGPHRPLTRLDDGGYRIDEPLTGHARHFTRPAADGIALLARITDRKQHTITFDYDEHGTPLAHPPLRRLPPQAHHRRRPRHRPEPGRGGRRRHRTSSSSATATPTATSPRSPTPQDRRSSSPTTSGCVSPRGTTPTGPLPLHLRRPGPLHRRGRRGRATSRSPSTTTRLIPPGPTAASPPSPPPRATSAVSSSTTGAWSSPRPTHWAARSPPPTTPIGTSPRQRINSGTAQPS